MTTGLRRKLVVLGDYCGKTTTVLTYIKDEFQRSPFISRLFVNITDVEVNGVFVEVEIWDTPSKQSYNAARKSIFVQADAVLLFFSIYSRDSFDNLRTTYMWEVLEITTKEIPILLVGTHCNIRNSKLEISAEEVKKFAREINAIGYVECSAVNKFNVEKVFMDAVSATIN